MHRARVLSTKMNNTSTTFIYPSASGAEQTMIGQMAIDIALLGFNDIGRLVTPSFLFRNRFYLQLSPHCPKMNKKSMWDAKKMSRFHWVDGTGSCHLAAARCVKLWSLNANLLFEEPHQLTKLLYRSIWNIFSRLAATVAFANESRFTLI